MLSAPPPVVSRTTKKNERSRTICPASNAWMASRENTPPAILRSKEKSNGCVIPAQCDEPVSGRKLSVLILCRVHTKKSIAPECPARKEQIPALTSFSRFRVAVLMYRLTPEHLDLVTEERRGFKVELFDRDEHFFFFLLHKLFRILDEVHFIEQKELFERPVMRRHQLFGNIPNLLMDTLRSDAVGFIVRDLYVPSAIGLPYGSRERAGHHVRIEKHAAGDIACGAANRLNKRCFGAEKSFFVRIKDCD